MARQTCPRCAEATCAQHAPTTTPHCSVCDKELRDDLDEARFVLDVNEEPDRDFFDLFRRRRGLLDLVIARVARALAARKVHRTFARRTRAQIAEWRRRAGVAVRAP
jgi:hypothetical protein